MEHQEGTFKGAGGIDLYYQHWRGQTPVQATLAVVHGLGSHSGHFDNLVRYIVPHGYQVYGFDLRGHGRSQGQRGYINSWAEFREDLRGFLHLMETQKAENPHFLLGHSLGGAIALDYALRFPDRLQGIIVTALPAGKVGINPIKMALGQILSKIWPRFSLNTGIEQTAGSRDPEVVAALCQDPLRHYKGTARLVTEYNAASTWIQTHAAELYIPLLMLHGGDDRIALPEGSEVFFQKVRCHDKERREYVGAYHDLYNDINHQEVISDIGNWLDLHLEGSTGCDLPTYSVCAEQPPSN